MEELIQAIFEAISSEPSRPDGSFTTAELQEDLIERGVSVSIKKLLRAIRQLKKDGKVQVIDHIPIIDISDRPTSVRGWRLIDDE